MAQQISIVLMDGEAVTVGRFTLSGRNRAPKVANYGDVSYMTDGRTTPKGALIYFPCDFVTLDGLDTVSPDT